jgi:hypothetical protein
MCFGVDGLVRLIWAGSCETLSGFWHQTEPMIFHARGGSAATGSFIQFQFVKVFRRDFLSRRYVPERM